MLLGIDIGGTSIKLAVLSPEGEIRRTIRSSTYERPDRGRLLGVLSKAISDISTAFEGPVTAVGVCAPGLADASGRIIKAVNVPGLEGLTPAELVRTAASDRLSPGVPISSHGDAYAAAYDFAKSHPTTGRLLALSMGTGIGAAVLDGPDERPLIVSGRGPGHIGQLDVGTPELERDVPIGPDGGRGSLEAYLGLPALKARFGDRLGQVLESGELSPKMPPLAALVKALRLVHAIYRPQVIVLLGGVGIRLAPVVPAIHEATNQELTGVAQPGWRLMSGTSDFHAALGAARLGGKPSTTESNIRS